MLKKVVYGIVAGSLVFAAQVASAGGTQFWNGERYETVTEGILKLPSGVEARRDAAAPKVAPQASTQLTLSFPAPYDRDEGYFN